MHHVKPGLPGTRELESGEIHATICHENDHTSVFRPDWYGENGVEKAWILSLNPGETSDADQNSN